MSDRPKSRVSQLSREERQLLDELLSLPPEDYEVVRDAPERLPRPRETEPDPEPEE